MNREEHPEAKALKLDSFTWLADELEKRQREHAISMGSSEFSRGAEHAYRAAQLTLRQILSKELDR